MNETLNPLQNAIEFSELHAVDAGKKEDREEREADRCFKYRNS